MHDHPHDVRPAAARDLTLILPADSAKKRLQGIFVLVVEDNPETQSIVARYLRHHGAYVHVVRHGVAALEFLATARVHVIVIDYSMPGMSGIELLTRIRERETGRPRMPAILFTAFGELHETARAVGFDVYLVKPLDPEILMEEIARLVGV